ncbi:MAG TPA: discoidin domain-containing protein [Burkholderiaceae bacterium]|nr:discoidin domain-containing protein [Burkholderiaceae bacterium]
MNVLGLRGLPTWRRLIVVCAWVATMLGGGDVNAQAQARIAERVLDDFDDASAWSVVATDDVKASLRVVPGAGGGARDRALCLEFDFGRVTGYVALRRKLPIDFPARFDLGFDVRGTMPPNALQLKFSDASGDNVWWMQRPDYQPPAQWQHQRVRQRHVGFAWGPTQDKVLRRTEWVEFVVATGGGPGDGQPNRGSLCVDRLSLRELPPPPQVAPTPVARASSSRDGHAPFDGLIASYDSDIKLRAAAADWEPLARDAEPTLTVDYGVAHEFSALLLHWRPGAEAVRYTIEASDDGVAWQTLQHVARARGALQANWLGESEARYLRLRFDRRRDAPAATIALRGIELRNALSPNAFFTMLGGRAPRGLYPRAYAGEQSYWTVLGVEGARIASLLSEDGVLEPVPGVGALEPLLIAHDPQANAPDGAGQVLGWRDAQIEQALIDGELPMPRVHWRAGDFTLDVQAFGEGTPDAAQALASYRVRNVGTRARSVTLALAWRPFQANPPTQFLAYPGGASPVRELEWDGRALRVNGALRVLPLTRPDAVSLEPLAAGQVTAWVGEPPGLREGRGVPAAQRQRMVDPAGYASAALSYRLTLKPGEERVIGVALPVRGAPPAPPQAALAQREAQVAQAWRARLGGVTLHGGEEVQEVARTLRTALGHILVNRSGPAVQPGARAYARSWIRDGAMTSTALLRLGRDDVARDFLRWYAPFQFANGKVPCCATLRGADPVPENDSHGELAYAAAELWHYTHDAALARAMWPHVRAALDYMEQLRQSERGIANRSAERGGYFGMMPPSISHEGYSDKAAYSYWDDHWAWIGYRSAVELAQGLGLNDEARRIAVQRDEFRRDLLASINTTAQRYKLDVLAGAADRGDFDPTSSTIALSPGGLLGTLPDALVRNTFERYWRDFEQRRADDAAGIRHGDGAYTPYEWRVVGSLVRLDQRERALEALRYFYRDRRPAGWRQWAEVVLRNVREPRFLGDMPHGWVASDHIRAVLDLFAYEHEGERSLVLAAGVPMAWLREGDGVAIDGLQTPYGTLAWRARASENRAEFDVRGLREMPPGGLWLRGPWPADAKVTIDGAAVAGPADAIRLPSTTAQVRIEWSRRP